jgi:hypothetical protein
LEGGEVTVILVPRGADLTSMMRKLLDFAGPRKAEVSYGTCPQRITVPEDLFYAYIDSQSGKGAGKEAEEGAGGGAKVEPTPDVSIAPSRPPAKIRPRKATKQ